MKPTRWVCLTGLLVMMLFVLGGCASKPAPAASAAPAPQTSTPAQVVVPGLDTLPKTAVQDEVTKVVDGDTLVAKHLGEVRLVGIDAPEHGWYGSDAAGDFLSEQVKGHPMALWVDVENPKDRYKRTRAIVFAQRDGKWYNVNRLLVAQGYAVVSVYKTSPEDPNKWLPDQQRARQLKLGSWRHYNSVEEFTAGKQALHQQQDEERVAQTKTTRQDAPAGTKYVGNARSLKFHRLTCKYLPARRNAIYFKTREEAVKAGFKPCGVCKP